MKLRDVRLAKRLTQDQLAAITGVTQAAISAIERGDVQSPSWDTVAKLCEALEVEPKDVFPVDTEHADAAASTEHLS